MSAPAAPKDNSLELEAMRQREAAEARQREQAEAERVRQELAGLRSSASTAARGSAKDYFSQQGLDADQYANPINAMIDQILAGINPSDPNPGSYFNDVGQRVFAQQETAGQNKAMRALDTIFAPNFEQNRIPFTMDDPILSSIEEEQYSDADSIIRNMLDRGVITNTGYGAAQENLNKQRAGVKARLNEVGTGQLASGQQKLREVANTGRQTASTIKLGQQFDPYSFSSQADQQFNDFLANLGNNIRAAVPGKLFNTAGLAAVAGSAQGAGNTAFNPAATNGIIEDDEDDDRGASGNPF